MRKVVRTYGVLLLGPEVAPLERFKWEEVKACEVDFHPMALWVWADPGCIVHRLTLAQQVLIDEPMPWTLFAPPMSFRLPLRTHWPEREPLPIESRKARQLYSDSPHAFSNPPRLKGAMRVVMTVEGPFRAAALFGDWYTEAKSDG